MFQRLSAILLAMCLLWVTQLYASGAQKVIAVSEQEQGSTITLARGAVLEVRLDSVPGTGYRWDTAVQEPSPLRLIEMRDVPLADNKRVGGQQIQLFRFEATRAGEVMLKLRYRRPWERDKPPVKTWSLTVIVP